jgi:hypothetical protein
MIPGARTLRSGALLMLVAAAGWVVARYAARPGSGGTIPPPPSTAALDSATVRLQGELTHAARAKLTQATAGTPAILVLLDSADIRVCEDLGRQLRELRNRAGPSLPLIVVTDSAAVVPIGTFARRERLRPARIVVLRAGNLIVGTPRVPTPAALVLDRAGNAVAGVGHPRRFSNVRVRSFADELSPSLPASAGTTPPPEPRRIR